MKVRWRSFVGFNVLLLAAGAIILLTIVLAAFVFSARAQLHAAESLKAARVDRLVLEVTSDLVDAETSQRGFALTRMETYLEPYEKALGQFEKDARDLRARIAEIDGGRVVDTAAVEGLIELGRRKMDLVTATLAQLRAGGVDQDIGLGSAAKGKQLMDEIRLRGTAIRETAAHYRTGQAAKMRDAAGTLTTLISLGVGMVVVLAIGGAMLIRRHMIELENARQDLIEINEDLEARVRERTEGVMRANEELQRYAYIVSHDLRAPLVNIMGFTAELEKATGTIRTYIDQQLGGARDDPRLKDVYCAADEDIPEALGFIRTSMNRMDGLIQEILKLSRAGRRALEPTELDTQSLVGDCIASIQQRFQEAGAQVVIDGFLPTIVSDRSAVQQIFTNLLDNAAKYLVADRPGRIVVRGRIDRWNAVFEVEDNGRGVASADHNRIFELFRRAGVQDRPGDGIGLAHTRALARRLGGDVTVASDGFSGTVFTVTIAKDLATRMRSTLN